MKAPWLTVTGKGAQGACGTCGALFILAIVYDRPACPLCGAPDREQQAEAEAHLRRRRSNPIAFEPGTRIRDVWTGAVAEVVKHDPRTGTTELRNTGTGTVQTMNSHNNAHYVAVREAE